MPSIPDLAAYAPIQPPAKGGPSDSTLATLYRAALGPVGAERYLPIFARFDATGRTAPQWNGLASLFTLSWLVFRQLWTAALVYVAAVEGLALLVLGMGRSLLQWPQAVEWGVLGAFGLAAFVIPGLYADTILYLDTRKRVAHAVATSNTMAEAHALLEQKASTRKRLNALILVNMALASVALWVYLVAPSSRLAPASLDAAVTVAQHQTPPPLPLADTAPSAAADTPPESPLPAAPAEPVNTTTALPVAAGLATTALAPAVAAVAAPAALPSPAAALAPASAPERPQNAAKAPKATDKPTAQTRDPSRSNTTQRPTPAELRAAARAEKQAKAKEAKAARQAKAAQAAKEAKEAKEAKAAKKASASKNTQSTRPAKATPPVTVGKAPGFYLNVGIFSEEANARKTQARLLNEGFPAFRQEIPSAKGTRIRVRVGPMSTRAQANATAQSIRAMGFQPTVFKQ